MKNLLPRRKRRQAQRGVNMDGSNIRASAAAFTKKYPFIAIVDPNSWGTADAQQVGSGAATDWDTGYQFGDVKSQNRSD
jgi:hypothetical protein